MQKNNNLVKRFGEEKYRRAEKLMLMNEVRPWDYFFSDTFTPASDDLENFIDVEEFKKMVSIVAHIPRNAVVLSLGCGIRDPFAFLLEKFGYEVIYVDISPVPLFLLEKKSVAANAKRLPFKNCCVDVITEFAFFDEPRLTHGKVISKEINRVLKKGGFILSQNAMKERDIKEINRLRKFWIHYEILFYLINNLKFQKVGCHGVLRK